MPPASPPAPAPSIWKRAQHPAQRDPTLRTRGKTHPLFHSAPGLDVRRARSAPKEEHSHRGIASFSHTPGGRREPVEGQKTRDQLACSAYRRRLPQLGALGRAHVSNWSTPQGTPPHWWPQKPTPLGEDGSAARSGGCPRPQMPWGVSGKSRGSAQKKPTAEKYARRARKFR